MVDIQGTTIAVNDTVAVAVRFGANKVKMFVGTIAAIASDNGETYLHVTPPAEAVRYVGDYARVPCTADGVCPLAIKSGFSTTPLEPTAVTFPEEA